MDGWVNGRRNGGGEGERRGRGEYIVSFYLKLLVYWKKNSNPEMLSNLPPSHSRFIPE